ncbi:MAG: hypothetical protein CMO38_03420 [Verrucomicrobiaceae bacterium]|nr:hypothetical protein [Verrucomicrobiaceae bacterium]
MSLIDRLERRLSWIAIPGVVKIIMLFQALVWLLNAYRGDEALLVALYLDKDLILSGEVWRLFSFIFIPPVGSTSIILMFFAVFFTIFLGSMLEEIWGSFKLTLYVIGGVLSVLISEFLIGFPIALVEGKMVGLFKFPTFLIIESILFACAVYNPNYVVRLFAIIPIRLFWIAILAAGLLFLQATNDLDVAGLILISLLHFFVVFVPGMKRSIQVKVQVSSRKNQFENAQMSKDEALHLCEYCGKTEKDDEELIFRVAANGTEFCEGCRDQASAALVTDLKQRGNQAGVLKNEEQKPSRMIERSSKKPNPVRKSKKERWGYDQEDSK